MIANHTFVHAQRLIPTQAKTGLEWATRRVIISTTWHGKQRVK